MMGWIAQMQINISFSNNSDSTFSLGDMTDSFLPFFLYFLLLIITLYYIKSKVKSNFYKIKTIKM